MARLPILAALAIVALAATGACQTPAPSKPDLARSASGPTADELSLGLLGPETPQVLREVALHPYAPPDPGDCPALAAQIARLDEALGPDVDVEVRTGKAKAIGDAAKGAVNGLVPYGDVLRWITGARAKQSARARAVLAGAARRGFLRGMALAKSCQLPKAAPPTDASAPAKPKG